jgi:hypothetical protein
MAATLRLLISSLGCVVFNVEVLLCFETSSKKFNDCCLASLVMWVLSLGTIDLTDDQIVAMTECN